MPVRPSRFGQLALTSSAQIFAPASARAASENSCTLLPQIEATVFALACSSAGKYSLRHRATPGPLSPTELSIDSPHEATRGAGLPAHSNAARDFTTIPPSVERSPYSDNSAPSPPVPAAVRTGPLSSTVPTVNNDTVNRAVPASWPHANRAPWSHQCPRPRLEPPPQSLDRALRAPCSHGELRLHRRKRWSLTGYL